MRRAIGTRVLLAAVGLCLLSAGCPRPAPRQAPRTRPAPDRLQGDWYMTTTLRARPGVGTPQKLLLAVNRQIQEVLAGRIQVPGVPPALMALLAPAVAQYLKQLVPAWASKLVQRLARIEAALSELQVESVETLRAQGDHRYAGQARWQRVTVRSGSLSVSAGPKEVPGLGTLKATSYTASEHTGYLRIRGLRVHQRLGPLVRWFAEALLRGLTCSTKLIPCFKTVEQALGALIPCDRLAALVAKASPALANLSGLVKGACVAQRQRLVTEIGKRLDQLSLRITYVRLQGDARIDGDRWVGGKWQGTLGAAYGGGQFRGTFTGRRARH